MACCILANVKEHAPPLAGASVGRGVRVVAAVDHVNRGARGGCRVSSCSAFLLLSGVLVYFDRVSSNVISTGQPPLPLISSSFF